MCELVFFTFVHIDILSHSLEVINFIDGLNDMFLCVGWQLLFLCDGPNYVLGEGWGWHSIFNIALITRKLLVLTGGISRDFVAH